MKRFFIIGILIIITCFSIFSQTRQIKDLENKRKRTLSEIENTNKLLLSTKKITSTLLSRIKLITEQINSRQQLVSILNQEVDAISKEQVQIEKEIEVLQVELSKKQENYATAVKGMLRKNHNSNRLIFILSGKSVGESMRRMKYIREYSEWRNDQAEDIKKKRIELSDKKLALEKNKKEKLQLLGQRRNEQNQLQKEEGNRQKEVLVASGKEKELQAELNKKQKQANALDNQIERLIAEEIARQQLEAKRIAEEKRRIAEEKRRIAEEKANANKPTKEKPAASSPSVVTKPPAPAELPIESKESFKLSSSFVANKGRFPMPNTGRSSITTHFGENSHAGSRVKTNSSGIDIHTQTGSQARSIYQGEVSRVIAFPGYNNCVIVRHGGYFTFYGNIQQVYVKQGDKIEAGQSLGLIYTDSEKGITELHFQLWNGTTKLNPELWLKR